MSVCGQNGQAEDDSGTEEVTATAATVREIYKQKPVSKVVRVLTVLAYLLSVSLAAILLSVYYVCVWKSPELPPLNDAGGGGAAEISARRADPHHQHLTNSTLYNHTGGGDSGVNGHPVALRVSDEKVPSSTIEATTDTAVEEPAATTESTLMNTTSYFSVNDTDVT